MPNAGGRAGDGGRRRRARARGDRRGARRQSSGPPPGARTAKRRRRAGPAHRSGPDRLRRRRHPRRSAPRARGSRGHSTVSVVYLIGAGPGDPGLMTLRRMECLAAADVVLYDHLVSPRLLRHAREDAEKIDVGVAAPQPLEQEAICYLIAEKTREGKTVARLKYGDPFVFGRGGAEALFLKEQGVRLEVVPGITAGIGAPTYAGVPITYPGGGDIVTLVRGLGDQGNQPTLDWSSLARIDGTIVFYVGAPHLTEILEALLSHGRPADDSAAIIYDGTLPTQRTTSGTLGEVAKSATDSSGPPVIVVVGPVVALREHLRWFDARPLFGK